MPRFDEKTLAASLKKGELYSVYLLSGSEQFLLEYALEQVVKAAVPGGKDSPLFKQFNGENFDINALVTEAEEMSMFFERKCLALMDADLEKLDAVSFDAIAALLADPNPATVLILYAAKKPLSQKSARGKKLWKLAEENGGAVLCEEKSPRELQRLITARAARGGSSMGEREASYLLERCGSDLLTLMTETDKLSAYRQGEAVSTADIDLLTRRNLEASVFDLSKFIRQKQGDKAFRLVDELISLKEEPIAIMGALNMAYLDLYRAKLGDLAKKGESAIAADFHYKSSFRVKNALRSCRDYTLPGLRACLAILSDTDIRLKSSRTEGRLLLEEAVFRLLQVK